MKRRATHHQSQISKKKEEIAVHALANLESSPEILAVNTLKAFSVKAISDAIINACRSNNIDALESLYIKVGKMAFQDALQIKDNDGRQAIHIVARDGKPELLDFLLKCGASLDATTNSGKTVKDCAIVGSNIHVLVYLFRMMGSNKPPLSQTSTATYDPDEHIFQILFSDEPPLAQTSMATHEADEDVVFLGEECQTDQPGTQISSLVLVKLQQENSRLRRENTSLREKLDNELLNNTLWEVNSQYTRMRIAARARVQPHKYLSQI